MMFVDIAHLSGPYEGTLMGAVALDADNPLFDVACTVVSSKNNDDYEWFMTVTLKCLGGMQRVIM